MSTGTELGQRGARRTRCRCLAISRPGPARPDSCSIGWPPRAPDAINLADVGVMAALLLGRLSLTLGIGIRTAAFR